MHFTIDDKRYVVGIAARPLILDGQPCKAKLARGNCTIWLSNELPRHERRRELFHELRHAWVDARGIASDEEADAIAAAEMMDTFMEQYLQQGGDVTLEALDPDPPAPASTIADLPIFQVEAYCGFCETKYAPGSIANDPPLFREEAKSFVMRRGFLCTNCDRVTIWSEACTPEGMPLGMILQFPQPTVLTGKAAGEWIAEHSERCRVVVA
jgi:hypothetical protein